MWSGATLAQTAPAADDAKGKPTEKVETIVVTGQRAALQSAQKIKQESDEIVDSIVADDIGKLPDRSVTEVLQRIVGVTIDRTMAKNDPEHYSVEGSGVNIRGLTWVRSELNGRDSFSANGGRSLNFEDVPPELMAGVDVYKNPSAEQIEGAIGGLVNLRTALPFDYPGLKGSLSLQSTYSPLREKSSPSGSVLLSNTWDTEFGKFGALIDLAYSESATRNDKIQVEPYYPRTDIVDGETVWVPKGAQWRSENFDRTRQGTYGALQWKQDSLESSLTLFRSDYKMEWVENALFAQSSPYNITVDDGAVWGPNGNLVKGTMRSDVDNGINFGADTRVMTRKSATQDVGWNLKWKASDQWTFSTDLQYIRATTNSFDSTVATGVAMPKESIDLSGDLPRLTFDDADRARLADPANYYWAFTMEHFDQSKATEKAWRGDAKYKFDDPVLVDLRFGVRLTDRDARTMNSGYNWAAITQPWMQGWYLAPGGLAYLNDPRFSGNTQLRTFDNFFNGQTSVPPALVFPGLNTALGYPDSYSTLHSYATTLCTEAHGGDSSSCFNWWNAPNLEDPKYHNQQQEQTQAAYAQLRFAFDDWKYPVDGNVGLRVVNTHNKADGYTVFTPPTSIPPNTTGETIPDIAGFSEAQKFEHEYVNVLPSLNLRMKAAKDLQFRFGYATGISRPDFTNLQAYTSLSETFTSTTLPDGTTRVDSVSLTGESRGNPMLKPVKSQQMDLTAEWYFGKTNSITFAAFYKELKDIIVQQTYVKQLTDRSGDLHDFVVTGPINGAKGHAAGFEVAYQQYFDMLPGWLSGFGLQANYTFVDSKRKLYNPVYSPYCSGGNTAANVNLNLNGCDTDGRTFGDLPIEGLSRDSFNLALLYDQGPVSARVAYSWRSKYLQAVNVNGTNGGDGTDTNPASPTVGQHNVAWALPTWQDDYGQVDAGVYYKWDENLQLGLEGQNLTDSTNKQLMQQHIGMMGRAWNSNGPRYTVTLRYSF